MSSHWDDIHAQSIRSMQRIAEDHHRVRDQMWRDWVESMTNIIVHRPMQSARISSYPVRVMLPQGI